MPVSTQGYCAGQAGAAALCSLQGQSCGEVLGCSPRVDRWAPIQPSAAAWLPHPVGQVWDRQEMEMEKCCWNKSGGTMRVEQISQHTKKHFITI